MKREPSKLGCGGRGGLSSLFGAIVFFCALPGSVARAQTTEGADTGLTLRWHAPGECPTEADVRARVDALLGRPSATVAALDARAFVARAGDGYALSLETVQGEHRGTRAMSDTSCVELARAAAAVIALAIDPTLTLAVPGDDVPAAQFPATEASPVVSAPAPVAVAERRAPAPLAARPRNGIAPEAWIGLIGALELGTLPGVAPGFGLALSARYDFLSLELMGLRLPTQRAAAAAAPGVGAEVDYVGLETRLCAHHVGPALSPGVCAGFGAGRLRAVSRGASTPGSGSVTWLTPRVGALLRYAVGSRFALHAGAQALLPVTRVEFTLENLDGAVYEPAPVALLIDAGVAVRFW